MIANTFKNTPINERANKEHFTKNVIDFLSKHPILLMTSVDLYNMARDVMERGKNPEEIVKILYESIGVLKYV